MNRRPSHFLAGRRTGLSRPVLILQAGNAFTISLAIGPAIGGLLLQTSPDAVWWGGALAAVLAGAVLLRLAGRIPDPLREGESRLGSAPAPA